MSNKDAFEDTFDDGLDTGGVTIQKTLWRQWPYLTVLFLSIAGVAYSNVSHQPLVGYWEFLAVAVAVMCVLTQWSFFPDRSGRLRLMITQILHWAAVLVMMNIMVLFRVRSMMTDPAVGLVLLSFLALGTFIAGVNFLSMPVAFLGLAMALTVPAIAWLTQSFLFLLLIAVLFIGLGVALWPIRSRRR